MRRIVLRLVVVAVMAAIAAALAMPAYADPEGCEAGAVEVTEGFTGGGGNLNCQGPGVFDQFLSGGSGGQEEFADTVPANSGAGGHSVSGVDPTTGDSFQTVQGGGHFNPDDGPNFTRAGRCEYTPFSEDCVGNIPPSG